MKPRSLIPFLIVAAGLMAIGAQAAGLADVPGFIAAHADVFAGLSLLGFAGETGIADPEIKAELTKISGAVKEMAEKAIAEAKRHGDMTTETKTKVDELLVKQGELQARLQEVEQKADRRGNGGAPEQKSLGQQFIESDQFKSFKEHGGLNHARAACAFPVKAITSATVGSVLMPERIPGVVVGPERRMTVRDLITPGTTNSASIQYLRETGFTNAAAPTPENTRKPESNITYDLVNGNVITIPHFVKAAKQILDDMPMLGSTIDGRLRYGLKLAEEAQLLKGSGTGNNLPGIYTMATSYAAPLVISSPTRIDVLRLALLQAELAEYPSTGIVLHPTDWAAIELLKDSTGAYIFANPQSLAQPGLWGRPVVTTQAMTVDTFLVGAFQLGAQVFDREQANVVIAYTNEDDFVKNMVTIRAEERLALAVYRPEAFVKGDITP